MRVGHPEPSGTGISLAVRREDKNAEQDTEGEGCLYGIHKNKTIPT